MSVNLKLKSEIALSGNNQKEFATIINMSESALSLKINGKSSFTEKEIKTISLALGTTPEQIFFDNTFRKEERTA